MAEGSALEVTAGWSEGIVISEADSPPLVCPICRTMMTAAAARRTTSTRFTRETPVLRCSFDGVRGWSPPALPTVRAVLESGSGPSSSASRSSTSAAPPDSSSSPALVPAPSSGDSSPSWRARSSENSGSAADSPGPSSPVDSSASCSSAQGFRCSGAVARKAASSSRCAPSSSDFIVRVLASFLFAAPLCATALAHGPFRGPVTCSHSACAAPAPPDRRRCSPRRRAAPAGPSAPSRSPG